MPVQSAWLDCLSLLPITGAVIVAVYTICWFREKTARDEIVLDLLQQIQDVLDKVRQRMRQESKRQP